MNLRGRRCCACFSAVSTSRLGGDRSTPLGELRPASALTIPVFPGLVWTAGGALVAVPPTSTVTVPVTPGSPLVAVPLTPTVTVPVTPRGPLVAVPGTLVVPPRAVCAISAGATVARLVMAGQPVSVALSSSVALAPGSVGTRRTVSGRAGLLAACATLGQFTGLAGRLLLRGGVSGLLLTGRRGCAPTGLGHGGSLNSGDSMRLGASSLP